LDEVRANAGLIAFIVLGLAQIAFAKLPRRRPRREARDKSHPEKGWMRWVMNGEVNSTSRVAGELKLFKRISSRCRCDRRGWTDRQR
jgi:hypothetical protein